MDRTDEDRAARFCDACGVTLDLHDDDSDDGGCHNAGLKADVLFHRPFA